MRALLLGLVLVGCSNAADGTTEGPLDAGGGDTGSAGEAPAPAGRAGQSVGGSGGASVSGSSAGQGVGGDGEAACAIEYFSRACAPCELHHERCGPDVAAWVTWDGRRFECADPAAYDCRQALADATAASEACCVEHFGYVPGAGGSP